MIISRGHSWQKPRVLAYEHNALRMDAHKWFNHKLETEVAGRGSGRVLCTCPRSRVSDAPFTPLGTLWRLFCSVANTNSRGFCLCLRSLNNATNTHALKSGQGGEELPCENGFIFQRVVFEVWSSTASIFNHSDDGDGLVVVRCCAFSFLPGFYQLEVVLLFTTYLVGLAAVARSKCPHK